MPSPNGGPPPEMTVKAVGLGLFLAFVFGSANAYLGMRAGQTVAATIPAAVIAMALFRLPAFRGGVLEQNIARTAASVGEALVAGAIFTIPAFMLVEINGARLWADLREPLLGGHADPAGGRAHRRVLHHSAAPRPVRRSRTCPSRKASPLSRLSGRARRAATRRNISSARWDLRALHPYPEERQRHSRFSASTRRAFSRFPRSVVQPFQLRAPADRHVTHFGRHPLVHAEPLARTDRHRIHYRPGALGDQLCQAA